MRKVICLVLFAACEFVLLAACELKPAPKKQPPAATPPAPVTAQPTAPTPPVAPPEGTAGAPAPGAAAPKVEISAPCLEVGSKIAQVLIDGETDPSQKRMLDQERTTITRRSGEACTVQGWSDAARACYLGTKTPADLKACETKFSPPPAPPRPKSNEG